MSRRFYKLTSSMTVPGRWHLAEPLDSQGQEVDNIWQFIEGHPVQVEDSLHVPVYRPGVPLEFTTTAAAATPIVHPRVAALFAELAPDEVQLLPVAVEGQSEPFQLLVTTRLIRCLDEKTSAEVRYWRPEDGQPEKVGQYRSVAGMRIDKARAGDAHVFRPWGWPVVLVVSGEIKNALERVGATGVKFTEV
jgi:hypothetical protein